MGPESDLEIAVQAARPLSSTQKLNLIGDFADATGRLADSIERHTVGEPLLGQIVTRGRRLVGSAATHGSLLRRHLIDAGDFLPDAQRIVNQRRRAWIGK